MVVRTCAADGGGWNDRDELVRLEKGHKTGLFKFERTPGVQEDASGTIDICFSDGCNRAAAVVAGDHFHQLKALIEIHPRLIITLFLLYRIQQYLISR